MTEEREAWLSVVVPVHNGSRTIERAIGSVLAQTGVEIEVVVVDDGSTDGSATVAASSGDGRVRVVRQVQAGVSVARNRGVRESRAPVVAFLDADDEVLPGWAASLLGALVEANVGMASCGVHREAEDRSVTVLLPEPLGPAFSQITARFLAGSFAVRRPVFDHAGGYRPELRFGEGFEFGLRLARCLADQGLRAAVVPAPLAVWHRETGRTHHPASLLTSAEAVLQRHAATLASDRVLLADHHAVAGVNAARLDDLGAARRHLFAAARNHPVPKAWGRFAIAAVRPLANRVWPITVDSIPRLPAPVADRPLLATPMLTVVIACYQGGEQLIEQVRAISPQLRAGRSELVLADNGSTDGSVSAAIAAGGPLVRSVPAQGQRGQSHARNKGAAAGRGEVLLFVDQDDRVQPTYLDSMLRALQDHPFVAARMDVDALNDPITRASRDLAQMTGLGKGLYPWAYGCTLGMDRNLFDAVGGFDEDLATAEDVDLCYRIQERFAIEPRFVPDAVVDYRFRSGRRQSFLQGMSYGRGGADIYLRHRRFGLRPDPPGRVGRQWVGLLRWLVAADASKRRRALFLSGARLGRLAGSWRRRVWFP